MTHDDPEQGGGRDSDLDDSVEPQIWHQYGLRPGISIGWVGLELTSAHIKAFEDAWDLLVVHEEWRDWVRQCLADGPFLYLAFREVDKRTLRKMKDGVSCNVPSDEVLEADSTGELRQFYGRVIRDIYQKWSTSSNCQPPPALPAF